MRLWTKIGLVLVFAVLFGILAFLGFLGALKLYAQFVPEPFGSALSDLEFFSLVVGVGALVLGGLQALLNLWLYHKKYVVFWLVNIVIALVLGGLASFFVIWMVWTVITLLNLFLVWFYTVLLHRQLNKVVKDMPT